jgi:hypothetical protein
MNIQPLKNRGGEMEEFMGDKLSVNPWLGMWVRPRETIRAIVQFKPGYLFPLLCLIYGFPLLLQMAQNFSLGDRFPMGGIVIGALVGAVFIGMIGINLVAALFYWTGKWIGGTGTFQTIRAAVAWSNVPNLVNSLIWVVNMASFGNRLFTHGFVETPFVGNELALIFFTSLVQVVIAVWGFVIVLKALGEVQGFSAWKALLNVLIPFFIVLVGLSILAWLLSMMAGGARVS